ncbi:hypothetical protein W97_04403 [Coniosporium apollinis CBS 100218]|uniref:30S ribosomal protein S2 n=1 Tax=Coniosporium apollinis (strain CBS 100218) TaxID=1168221 RepID=R7YU34_CONA1|nr:uncharacterized protein W97_04403 [Coniosporium apollinis CBS 100218]EON65166.1 hypothetical protein W97_04403 [Coniosporium apollinis CBS 100218]
MIIRHLALRQGRRALTSQPIRRWTRFFASQVDTVEASLQTTLGEIRKVEAFVNSRSDHPVSPVDADPSSTPDNDASPEENLSNLGSEITPHYQPHTLLTNPPSPSDITLELLLASGAHLGHNTSLWNPGNAKYIHGIRDGVHILSLETTAAHLRRACKIVTEVARRGGLILFVGTRAGQDRCVVKAAELAGGCHLFDRWTPGSITNGQQILGNCRMKVVDELDREIPDFEEQLLDRSVLKPDLVVCLNPLENYVLLHECGLNNIPTIGIIDTNADPTWVTYPIPANDDSLRCVQVIAGVLGRAGEAGNKMRLEAASQGEVTYQPAQGLKMPAEKKDGEGQASSGSAPVSELGFLQTLM